MEEDTVELVDYIRVVWKRKILIIVGTLVCIVVGVVVSPGPQVTYHAKATVKIGKVLDTNAEKTFIDTPANLAKIIPIKYALEDDEALGYGFGVEVIAGTALVDINIEGSDREKTKEFLRMVIERIIEDHGKITETASHSYELLIERREADIDKIMNDYDEEALTLTEKNITIKRKKDLELGVSEVDLFLLMSIQNNLKERQETIRALHDKNFQCQLIIKYLKEHKTTLISGIEENVIIKKNKKRNVLLAGFGGLTISIFLAFFVEYLGNVMEKEKRKSMS